MAQEQQKILASLLPEDNVYLLSAGVWTSKEPGSKPLQMAQVLDLDQGRLFPRVPLVSILARADEWVEYTGDQKVLPDLLKQVTVVPAPPGLYQY